MRAMKDSGIECVGDIPVDWSMRRLRFLCFITTGNQDTQDNDPEGEYPFYVRSPIVERSHKYTFDGPAILMSGDGAGAGRIFHKVSGKYACHQRVYSMQNIHDIDSAFLFYYLRELFPVTLEMANAKSTVDSVRLPMLQDFTVLLPSPAEQQRIAAYLDEQCGEIDKVLAKTRESIEEYKKLKQSVITEAVTKGIRPDRPMKDSGIEWIGDIPEEWEVRRLKYCAVLNPKCDFSHLPADAYVTFTPMELVGYGDYQNNAESLKKLSGAYTPFQDGDIALAKVTPCFENGKIAIMTGLHSGVGFGSSELFVIRAVEINTKFLFYFLQNEGFKDVACSTMTGTGGLKRVSPDFVHNCPIAIPSLTEQQRIAAYLDEQCGEIDRLIAKKEQIISELEGYKKSLIYECVTGKREVAG